MLKFPLLHNHRVCPSFPAVSSKLLPPNVASLALLVFSASLFSACGMGRKPDLATIGSIRGEPTLLNGEVQHTPARLGELVMFEGIIYQICMWRTSASGRHYGFLIQNSAAQSDQNPNTSDGLFIYCGNALTLPHGKGDYTPKTGDHVILNGIIKNRYGQTEVSKPEVIKVVDNNLDFAKILPATELHPPDGLGEANLYFERLENMRCYLPPDSMVVNRRRINHRNADSNIIVIRGDHPVAKRQNKMHRRTFRDPHPLDDNKAKTHDNGNGYRISIGCKALMYANNDDQLHLSPARTFDTVKTALTGGLLFVYGSYTIQANQQLVIEPGTDPSSLSPDAHPADTDSFSIATFNVENLYDARNDPFDGCDFMDDPGCPGVRGPADYAPTNAAVYEARLDAMASQIIDHMHSPDIIMIQEAEDQDICAIVEGVLQETKANHADNQPDTLQELALHITGKGGPTYIAVNDRDGADPRGIITAFMYRPDRVELITAQTDHPILGANPAIEYPFAPLGYVNHVQNPKAFNAFYDGQLDHDDLLDVTFSRAVQVGHFRVYPEEVGHGKSTELYLLNNHFSSRPDARIERRRHQATFNASLALAIQKSDPDAFVLVGGDLNVFPRPDDPIAESPSDQLGSLYEQGLYNTYDRFISDFPEGAYTYVYRGQAGTLDHFFLNQRLKGLLEHATILHINSDWPEEYNGDGPMGVTDHDPIVARFKFAD